jgi:hypothetical protein
MCGGCTSELPRLSRRNSQSPTLRLNANGNKHLFGDASTTTNDENFAATSTEFCTFPSTTKFVSNVDEPSYIMFYTELQCFHCLRSVFDQSRATFFSHCRRYKKSLVRERGQVARLVIRFEEVPLKKLKITCFSLLSHVEEV